LVELVAELPGINVTSTGRTAANLIVLNHGIVAKIAARSPALLRKVITNTDRSFPVFGINSLLKDAIA
jgi:hypothetical protein